MTTLREAAQQALEALEQSETTVRYDGFGMAHREAERKHQAAIDALRASLVDGDKVAPTEPVAWMHTDPDNSRVKFLVWRENEPAFRGVWIKTPLYTAPPQRRPLTEEEIEKLLIESAGMTVQFSDVDLRLARAVERVHGIT